jgi:hypothetical protein
LNLTGIYFSIITPRNKNSSIDYKKKIDNADLVDKNNIYNNPLQEIPEYIFLGDNSGLDNNNFEYLPALKKKIEIRDP